MNDFHVYETFAGPVYAYFCLYVDLSLNLFKLNIYRAVLRFQTFKF